MRVVSTVALVAALGLGALAQAPGQKAPQERREPPAPKNLQVLPKDIPRPELIAKMRYIAKSLGVRCDFCHQTSDFSADTKDPKTIARKMLRMVDAINTENFSGRQEVNCYTCHRGSIHPISQPPAEPPKGGGR